MNSFLRQSTASQTRIIGPFVDDTDFKTLETGLDASEEMHRMGAAVRAKP